MISRRVKSFSHRRRPCTCTLRLNTPGSPADCNRSKKSYKKGLSERPSDPCPPPNTLQAGHADTRPRVSAQQPVAPSPALSSSSLRGLGPRRHAIEEHLSQCPDVIGEASSHGRRPGLPLPG